MHIIRFGFGMRADNSVISSNKQRQCCFFFKLDVNIANKPYLTWYMYTGLQFEQKPGSFVTSLLYIMMQHLDLRGIP